MVSLRVGTMQLHKLHQHASELEQSGGGRGRVEVEGLRGGKRWVEKGKGGHTMTMSTPEHSWKHTHSRSSGRSNNYMQSGRSKTSNHSWMGRCCPSAPSALEPPGA